MARVASNKSSLFFKKSSSSSSTSSVHPSSHRRFDRCLRVLRRLRPVLVNDLDVSEVLDRLSSKVEDSVCGLRSDFGVSLASREDRVLALLDHLETTDEASVLAFVDAVRHQHRHLGSLLEKMIKNYNSDDDNDDNDENVRERTAIAGEELRKILHQSSAHRRFLHGGPCDGGSREPRSGPSTVNQQQNPSDDDDDDDDDYLRCFVVSSRGKMQTEKWIQYSDIRKHDDDSSTEKTFMAVVTKDLVFRRINSQSVPVLVRHPLIHFRHVYVLDDDSKYMTATSKDNRRPDASKGRSLRGQSSRSQNALRIESFRRRHQDNSSAAENVLSLKTLNSLGPPLPPKPENLPRLSFLPDGKAQWQSTSQPPALGSFEFQLIQDSQTPLSPPPLPPPLPARSITAAKCFQTDDRPKDEKMENCFKNSCHLEELRASLNCSVGSDVIGKCTKEPKDDDDDDLLLNFSVEIEDSYEAVGLPVDLDLDLAPQSSSKDEKNDVEWKADCTLTEAVISSSANCTSLRSSDLLHSRSKADSTPEVNESKVVYAGKLNARDSGVDSVVSQGFSDSPFGPDPEPEGFPGCVLGDLKVLGSDRDSSSSEFSYYEDIEIFSDGCQSPSAYLDPDSSDRRNILEFPFEQVGGFLESSPDKKVIPCGSLLLVETEEVCPPETQALEEGGEKDPLVNYRGAMLGYDKEGFAFYLPSHALKRHGDPRDEDWFYPIPITPHEATVFLNREKQTGCFVVYRPRNSAPTGAQFLLSVCRAEGDVVHYSIVENVHGDFKVKGHDHSFMTISELVSYFRRNQSHLATRLRRPLKDARMPITPGYHYPERLEIRKTEVQLDGTMGGHGGRGVVCRGQLNGSSVTVKILSRDSSSTEDDDFLEEAQTLMSLKHENIVRLIGLCCRSRPFYVITEYFDRGSLLECLHNNVIRSDSIEELFDVCLQVVGAMSYLEGLRFLLHRALAAKNFFVTHDMLVKLTNFERARTVVDDNYLACETEEITVRWAAPEVLLQSSYSTKSDVWAAGVVFWEIFSAGACPYAKLTDEETAVYVTDGGRLERPGSCTSDLFLLMKSCWRPLVSDRPSFRAIQEKFKGNSSVYSYSGQTQQHLSPVTIVVPPSSPRIPNVPQLPMKVKVTTPVKPSATPTVATKTPRHPSTLRESRSAEGSLRAIAENAKDHGSVSGGGGGGGGGQLRVPVSVVGRQQPVVGSSGGERVSSSDSSSVVSASVSNDFDKDDLSRGEKIRNSIRKLITGNKTAK